jgi:hypothetical protein
MIKIDKEDVQVFLDYYDKTRLVLEFEDAFSRMDHETPGRQYRGEHIEAEYPTIWEFFNTIVDDKS